MMPTFDVKKQHPVRVDEFELLEQDTQRSDPTWQPGFKERFPWLSFGALILMLFCAGCAIVVLLHNDGKTERQWYRIAKIKPSVLLAAINSAYNICLAILITEGAAIAWWRKVLHGRTVTELHRTWSFSTSALELVRGIGKWNSVAVTALAAKVAIIDGILLQRATSTFSSADSESQMKTITGAIVQELPQSFSGYYSGNTGTVGSLTSNFASIVRLWSVSPGNILDAYFDSAAGHPGNLGRLSTDCIGSCTLSVPGAGFSVSCTTASDAIDYGREAESYMENHISTPDYPILSANFSFLLPGDETSYAFIKMSLVYMNSEHNASSDNSYGSCPGILKRKTCELRPAIVQYPIVVIGTQNTANAQGRSIAGSNAGVTMSAVISDLVTPWGQEETTDFSDSQRQLPDFVVDRLIDVNETRPTSGDGTTIGGVALALQNLFSASVNVTYSGIKGWKLSQGGSFAQTWLPPQQQIADYCNFSMTDPTTYLVRQMNSLMLTTSIFAASQNESSWTYPQNFTATVTTDTIYYQTHPTFLWLALASMIVCIMCVLPAYYGFWELGRKVSLGPLEIAAAFQAPVLYTSSVATGEVSILLKEVGDKRVQYGYTQGRQAVAEPEIVERPAVS